MFNQELQKDKYLAFVIVIVFAGAYIATKIDAFGTLLNVALGCLVTLLTQTQKGEKNGGGSN